MDQFLNLFGQQKQPEDNTIENYQGNTQQALPGGGGTWEFEMALPQQQHNLQNEVSPEFTIPGGIPQEAIDIQDSTIEGYFNNIGWNFEKLDERLWILKFKGGAKDYDIFVELTPYYLTLVIPVIERVREACREKLWYHLLRMNYQSSLVRFGLNKRDEVLLTLEISTQRISYNEFKKGVENLCNLVDDSFPELLYLSQKPDAISSFKKETEAPMQTIEQQPPEI